MRRKHHIYALTDKDGQRFYVGQTMELRKRLTTHRLNKRVPLFHSRVKDLIVLETVETPDEAQEKENAWIAKLRAEGCQLVNRNAGGLVKIETEPQFLCVETGEQFFNIAELAHYTGRSAGTLERNFLDSYEPNDLIELVMDYAEDGAEQIKTFARIPQKETENKTC